MFLMTELVEDVNYIIEGDGGVGKNYFIEGVWMQSGIKNRNGRLYPEEVLGKEVNNYIKEKVNTHAAYGELGHPTGPTINLDRASHLIKSLKQEGKDWVGRAKVMNTPMGMIVKEIMNEGGRLGVSSRGMGSLKEMNGIQEVQSDFRLATAGDIVSDPSAPKAFVNGIMEGVEWIYDKSTNHWSEQIIGRAEKLGKKNIRELEKKAGIILEAWLSSL